MSIVSSIAQSMVQTTRAFSIQEVQDILSLHKAEPFQILVESNNAEIKVVFHSTTRKSACRRFRRLQAMEELRERLPIGIKISAIFSE